MGESFSRSGLNEDEGGLLPMDIKGPVGETAGKVWDLLNRDGPQTLTEMKKKLGLTSELLSFAVGWLAREDKADMTREKSVFRHLLMPWHSRRRLRVPR